MRFRAILIIIGLFLLMACQKSVYFNDFEKSLLDIYQEGDTLIFESDKGLLDTTYIVLKDVGYADWNPFAHSGKYKMLSGKIYYGLDKDREDNMFLYDILSLYKSHPDTTRMYLSYKKNYMSGKFNNLSVKSLEGYKVGDYLYRFNEIRKNEAITEETQLFFDLRYGIVKYMTNEGEVWNRINIKGK